MPLLLDPEQSALAIDGIRRRHKSAYKGIEDAKIGILAFKSIDMEVDTDSGNRDIYGVATTDDVDESEEVMLPEGADTTYIDAIKKLFVDHQYGCETDIGMIRWVKKLANGRGWKYRARIYEGLTNPLADDTLKKITQSGHYGVSIGFDALDYGPPTALEQKKYPMARSIVRKWRWIELSVTPTPCNSYSYAVAAGMLTGAKRLELIESLVTKGMMKKDSAEAIGLSHINLRSVIRLGDVPRPSPMRLG